MHAASQLFWSGRRVAMTGHTGFKGTWLASWLAELGAEVTGIGQAPATEPSLFVASGCSGAHSQPHRRRPLARAAGTPPARGPAGGRVPSGRAAAGHRRAWTIRWPPCREHPRRRQPARGGARLAVARAVVVITSDKCYLRPDRRCAEGDPLGGHDPYSASKACAEIVTHAFRHSYFPPDAGVGLATVRAGTSSAAATSRPAACCPIWSAPSPRRARGPAPPRRDPALAACARRAGRLPPSRRAPRGQSRLVRHRLELRPGRGRELDRGPDRRRSRRNASAAAPGGRPRATSRSRCRRLLLSSEQARRWLGWRPRLATEQSVIWAVDGYRALLRSTTRLAGRADPGLLRP